MTASRIVLCFCLSFIAGIFIASLFLIPVIVNYGVLFFGVFLVVFGLFPGNKKFFLFGFCLLFLFFGIFRYQSLFFKIPAITEHNDTGKEVVLIGIVLEEPEIGDKILRLKVQPENSEGKVLVTADRYPEYKYGDKLKIKGFLKTPSQDLNGFNYKDYLKKDGIYSVAEWPEIEFAGKNSGNPLMKLILSFKNKFKESARKFISPPQQGILEALIFGDEGRISKEWQNKLNITGTRHIVAVSGMNITIISALLLNFFLALGFWRRQAFYGSIISIIIYISMIGFPASAVRAGVMAGLFLAAQNFGRLSDASRTIVFASTFMLWQNPLLLKFDVGFQLSFLAMMGIVYLQPYFSDLLKKIPNPKIFPVRVTLAASLSAQVFALPILIFNFGQISLVSPLTNILIVPFLAPITILIFAFGLLAMVFYPLAFILFPFVWLFVTYILKIIDWFSKIPFSSLVINNIHWLWLAIFYLILGFAVRQLKEKEKLKFLDY